MACENKTFICTECMAVTSNPEAHTWDDCHHSWEDISDDVGEMEESEEIEEDEEMEEGEYEEMYEQHMEYKRVYCSY